MPVGSRRPPPGQSFPFLHKGQGLKTKINYPTLRTTQAVPGPSTSRRGEEQGEGSADHDSPSSYGHEQPPFASRSRDIAADTDLAWQGVSTRRTVQTADSGFDQAGNLNNEQLSISSPEDYSSSPPSSCVSRTNVELRKEHALPVQQRARMENHSLPETEVTVPSPMLASTPHPDEIVHSPEMLPVDNRETCILGDTTNVMERSDDAVLQRNGGTKGALPIHTDEARSRGQNEVLHNGRFVSRDVRRRHDARPDGGVHAQVNPQYNVRENQQQFTPNGVPRVAIHEQTSRGSGPRYTNVETKLIGQLRDVICHLDYADVQQRARAKELEDAYKRFQQDVLDFEAEKEAEKDRVLRTRRELERQKRNFTKDGAEREKAFAEQIDDLTKTIAEKDRQMSTLRLRLNKARELLEAKDKELNESTKKTERLEKTCKILQRQMAQLRGNYAKQSHELAAEIQAARTRNLRRKGAIGILPTLDKNTPREPQEPSLAEETDTEKQRAVRERSKCVSWADATVPGTTHQASASKNPREMELIEEGTACFGPCRLFKNSLGDWTKITTTACGCDFFEYSNTDVRWLCCDRSIQVYYYGVVGATVISLANGRTIRYFNDGQIEIYRLSGEISRFDSVTSQRCETMLDANGSRYVEIFDCAGYCLRMWDGGHSSERFNERSSPRGHPEDRYVYNHSNVEPEWVEPDFCARRCPDGSLKIKFSHVMICCLGLEDVGYVKHTTRLEDGQERKRMCVEWGHVAREKQRQIESRKCQRLTALNATM